MLSHTEKKMMDLRWATNMVSYDIPTSKSPRFSTKLDTLKPPPNWMSELTPASDPVCSAYETFLRLPELRSLWVSNCFPGWKNEPILKPALQALEITFRFVSIELSDPRPYSNKKQWKRRLEFLTSSQLQVIALLIEDEAEDPETRGTVPIVDLTSPGGFIDRENSSTEVWKLSGETTVVSQPSESSLLPRLATWKTSEDIAQKMLYSIECEMRMCPYTLGLGEPNLSGKPNLNYDSIVKPSELHSLKKSPSEQSNLNKNFENRILYTIHQILESWIHVSKNLLIRINDRIDGEKFEKASNDCWLLERIWKLLAEIEDLNLLNDPDDFLRLKTQLGINSLSTESDLFCFRSRGLVEITKLSKELKQKVPYILAVEVDPTGGPRIQEAAMRLYRKEKEVGGDKIYLIQGMQAVEVAVKKFYYGYKKLVGVVMGSLEAERDYRVEQVYLEPTWFPSLDGAKTFLGEFWRSEGGAGSGAKI